MFVVQHVSACEYRAGVFFTQHAYADAWNSDAVLHPHACSDC